MQVLCNVRPHPPWLCRSKQKWFQLKSTHIHLLFFFFKHLSHQMESKVRTQSPSRPSEWPSCLNIPESTVKRLGTLKTTTTPPPSKLKDFPLHWNRNTRVALQVFTAWIFTPTLLTRSVALDNTHLVFFYAFPHLLSTCVLCWKATRWALSDTWLINVQKCKKVTCLLRVYWPRPSSMLQLKEYMLVFLLYFFFLKHI